jgi:hypothetical protein
MRVPSSVVINTNDRTILKELSRIRKERTENPLSKQREEIHILSDFDKIMQSLGIQKDMNLLLKKLRENPDILKDLIKEKGPTKRKLSRK